MIRNTWLAIALLGVGCGPTQQAGPLPLPVRTDSVADRVLALLELARRAPESGIPVPPDVALAERVLDSSTPDERSALEPLLLRIWLELARGFAGQRVEPRAIDSLWDVRPEPVDVAALLAAAVPSVDWLAPLEALDRRPPGYAALRRELARYRAIAAAGGWPIVNAAAGPTVGAPGAAVIALRARLAATGDLGDDAEGLDEWDAALEAALRRFQRRHGLVEDGLLNAATVRALNVPAETRVAQIVVNLERWRWLPRELAPPYVLVNIPAFALTYAGTDTTIERPVILGRHDWPTPMLSSTITHVVVAPPWNVPPGIARAELVPLLRADTGYANRNGIVVYRLGNGEPMAVDPAMVDWSGAADPDWPYQLMQLPGPANPLGSVKLVLANRFSVYLHDTPAVDLFGTAQRALSHGCVRVQGALQLAADLLRDTAGPWPLARLSEVAAARRTRWIRLARPVAVHLAYFTAWVDEWGELQFRDDLYGWDADLGVKLLHPRPDTPSEFDF